MHCSFSEDWEKQRQENKTAKKGCYHKKNQKHLLENIKPMASDNQDYRLIILLALKMKFSEFLHKETI